MIVNHLISFLNPTFIAAVNNRNSPEACLSNFTTKPYNTQRLCYMCCVWGKCISWDLRARGSWETPASKSHATWFPRGRAVSHRAHRGLFSSLLLKQQQWVKLNRGLRPPFPCSAPQRRCGTIIIQPIYERQPTCCSAVYFVVSTNNFVSVKWKEMEVKWIVASFNTWKYVDSTSCF